MKKFLFVLALCLSMLNPPYAEAGFFDFISEKASDAVDFASEVANNEVHFYDWAMKDDKVVSCYFIPSTKKKTEYGLIFKDEGYSIEVIMKENDKIVVREEFEFMEIDGEWEYKDFFSSEKKWLKNELIFVK